MNTKLYVDNLAASTTYNDLLDLFSAHGNVAEVNLPVDRASGRLRGFGFVTMATPAGARAAVQALHGKQIAAHTLTVSEAWPHEAHAARPAKAGNPAAVLAGFTKPSLKGTS